MSELNGKESLNTRHISSNLRAYEYARSGFFELYIPASELTNLYRIDVSKANENPGESDIFNSLSVQEALRLNVVKSSVPNFSVETDSIRRGNDVINFATTPTFGEGSFVVDDFVGLNTKEMLYAWLNCAYDQNSRAGGYMWEYKKTAYLIEYTQKHDQIRYWELEGMFIKQISEDDFDKSNDSKRQLSVTFIFDRATMHRNNFDFNNN